MNELTKSQTKTKKSALTREKILAAANQLISERGSSEFQMSEVAQLCNMSKGALYYYFEDKDAVVEELLARDLDQFVQEIETAVADAKTPDEALQVLCVGFAQGLKKSNTIVAAMATELMGGGPEVLSHIEKRFSRIDSVIANQIERAKEIGRIRADVDPLLISSCISGMFFFAAFSKRRVNTSDFDADELAHELMEFILKGIAAS